MTDSVPQTKGQPTAEAEVPLANRPPCEPLPAFRPDVDVLAQAEAGRPDRCLVRDPKSGLVFDFSSKDIFLCRQMDGRTPPEAIRARFRERYGLDISAEHLDAFIRQMGRSGLLTSAPQADESLLTWESMKPLRFLSGPRLARLERAVGWIFSTAGLILLGALWLGALFVLSRRGGEIAGQVQDLLRSLAQGGRRGGPSPEGYLGLAWILIFLPSLREVAKAVLFRRDTSRFAEVRYAWQWRCIPRLMFDVNALASMEKPIQRLHVAAAGLQVELLIIASSILGWDMQRMSGPIQSFLFSLGLASTLSFLFNAIPVGKQDGSLILAVWLDIPDLRRRAVQTARTWLLGRALPEPLDDGRRRGFTGYGLCADLYAISLTTAILGFSGYCLATWLQGFGALLFIGVLGLRFEKEIRRAAVSVLARTKTGKLTRNQKRIAAAVSVAALLGLALLPCPLRVGGEFSVRPAEKREIRAEVASQIESIPVDEGAWVTNRQLVVELSRRFLQRDLDLAVASLDREKQKLALLEKGARPEEIAVAEQQVVVADTAYQHSTNAFARTRQLHEKGHVSDQDYESVMKQMDIDREGLELARRNLSLIKSGSRKENIEAQRAEVRRLAADVAHIEDDLARTWVRSPIAGQIATLHLRERLGQSVAVGDVLAVTEDKRKTSIRIAVPEEYAADVRVGAAVTARAWAFPGTVFTGTVTEIAPTIIERSDDVIQQATVEQEKGMVRNLSSPAENVVPVLADVGNAKGLLLSEMTGYAKVRGPRRSLGYVLLNPLIRFFRVRVWSWLP